MPPQKQSKQSTAICQSRNYRQFEIGGGHLSQSRTSFLVTRSFIQLGLSGLSANWSNQFESNFHFIQFGAIRVIRRFARTCPIDSAYPRIDPIDSNQFESNFCFIQFGAIRVIRRFIRIDSDYPRICPIDPAYPQIDPIDSNQFESNFRFIPFGAIRIIHESCLTSWDYRNVVADTHVLCRSAEASRRWRKLWQRHRPSA